MKNDKLLYESEWISVYESEKQFTYCQRKGIDSIAALLFRIVDQKYEVMVHYQPLPEIKTKQYWNQCFPCSVTGSIDDDEDPQDCAIREVLEEAGFTINSNHIVKTYQTVATTQMNEIVYNYLIDVTGLTQHEPLTDGSIFEEVAYNVWLSFDEFEELMFSELTISSLWALYATLKNYKKSN